MINIFYGVLLALLAAPAHGAEQMLPLTLRVAQYDAKLNAFLLSGDYQNPLQQPLRAWRGELRLSAPDGSQTIGLLLEQQARRPVWPNETGVWSAWIDFKADLPEHLTLQEWLKKGDAQALPAQLRLLRVLYEDGSQQAF